MQPEQYMRYIKKLPVLLLWLCILLVVFLGARFIWNVVSYGTLTITTGSKTANITISSAATTAAKAAVVQKGRGTITTKLRSGTYLVSVEDGAAGTSQLVSVGRRSHQYVSLSLPKPPVVEPVLYTGVLDVATDSTRMAYIINSGFSGVSSINSNNEVSTIAGSQSVVSITWADAQYGVGQDVSGNLYVVDGNAAHPLQSPLSSLSNVSGTVYAVAPNKTIYIGLGAYVYRGTEKGGFTQIYDNFSPNDSLVASNNEVMVLSPGMHQSGKATLIDTTGKQISKNFGAALGGWTQWSRGGKYILLSVGPKPVLFDSSLKQVGSIPEAANTSSGIPQTAVINNGSWLDDNTLFYSYGGQLWSYNLSQQKSNIVATMPNGEIIKSISVSADGSYVYLTDSRKDTTDPSVVRRVGLHNQPVADVVLRLQDILPINNGSYIVGLRNFMGTPTVVTIAASDIDPNDALQQTQDALQSIVGSSSVNYSVESGADF